MVDQKSTDAALSPAVNIFYEKKTLEDFPQKAKFYAEAPLTATVPKGSGSTVEWTRYVKPAKSYSDATSEFTNNQVYMSATTVSKTLTLRNGYVQLSEFVSFVAISNALTQAMDRVSDTAAESLDTRVRNDIGFLVADVALKSAKYFDNMAIDGGTLNSSGIGVRMYTRGFPIYHNKVKLATSATVVGIASSGMTMKTLFHASRVLQGNNIPMFSDGFYKGITHPDVAYQMVSNPGFKGWDSPTSSGSAKKSAAMAMEIFTPAGIKMMTTTLGYKFPLTGDNLGTSSGNVYASLVYGKEAYGVAELAGMAGFKLTMKESGNGNTSDPNSLYKTVGYKFYTAAQILNKSAGLWVVTTGL